MTVIFKWNKMRYAFIMNAGMLRNLDNGEILSLGRCCMALQDAANAASKAQSRIL